MAGSISLKWGTIQSWSELDDAAVKAAQKFVDLGMSMSAVEQNMTPEHIDALCDLIDVVDEPIINDWSGDEMTREEAKKYVRDYRR